jgi:hypothetical protein
MEMSGLPYPRGKSPPPPPYPKNRRLYRNALHLSSLRREPWCPANTTALPSGGVGSHIHKVPKSAAEARCTAVWTHTDRASTLGQKPAQVHAITNSQSITYQWQFWYAFRKQMTAGVRNDLRRHMGIYFRIYSHLVCLLTSSCIRVKNAIHATEA